jgi:hypothetical protein
VDRSGAGSTGIGTFAGVDQVLRDISELDVEVLRRSTQNVEGLIGADPLTFHQDPLRLSDDFGLS